MQLFKFTGNSIDGAIAFTFGTTDTAVVDFESEKFAAGSGGAFFVPDVGDVFVLEVT